MSQSKLGCPRCGADLERLDSDPHVLVCASCGERVLPHAVYTPQHLGFPPPVPSKNVRVQTRSLRGHPERVAILREHVPRMRARPMGELFRDVQTADHLDLGLLSVREAENLQTLCPELELVVVLEVEPP